MKYNILFLIIGVIILIFIVIITVLMIWNKNRKRGIAESGGYQIAAVSGIGKRAEQQDAIWFSGMSEDMTDRYAHDREAAASAEQSEANPILGCFVQKEDECIAIVADGMGGLQNGGAISRLIVNVMREAFFYPDKPREAVAFLQNALWKINESVNEYLAFGINENGGSTDVTVYIKNRQLYYLSVGDSRVYLVHTCGIRGKKKNSSKRQSWIRKLNLEHNFGVELDDLAQRGMISEEEARENIRRSALTSYVGMGEITKVDGNTIPILLEEGDIVLLMSDGVFNTISEQEILQCAQESSSRKIVSQIDKRIAKAEKMKQDNYSVIAIRVV